MGSVSLGTLLAACGSDGDTAPGGPPTGDGRPVEVEPRKGRDLEDLFDETSACTLTAEQIEGPFYFEADTIRTDIREDREGMPLRLAFRVRDAERCEPLRNAVVDVWHADATGIYSGFEGGTGETFLRGAQVTGPGGIAEFETIYPGGYPGRTPHIHAKVHVDNTTVATTQLYFDEAISTAVYETGAPYQPSAGSTTNASDGFFDESLLLDLSEEGDGYLATISFDVATGPT